MKIAKKLVHFTVVGILGLNFTGCSSMKEALQATFEVKTIEGQGQRAAVGMAIVRQNNIMLEDLEISGAAKWPEAIAADITPKEKAYINKIMSQDAFYATSHITFPYYKQKLGGALGGMFGNMGVSSLTYRAYKNMMVLFGDNPVMWPNVLTSKWGFTDFLKFEKDENRKLVEVEAGEGNLFKNISDAVIALTPENFQKELTTMKEALADAIADVDSLNGQKGDLEAKIKENEVELSKAADKRKDGFVALTAAEIGKLNAEIDTFEPKIDAAEEKSDKAEEIYFTKLDAAVEALKSDMKLNDEQVKLAQKVTIATDNVQNGSGQAGTMFAIALTNGILALPTLQTEIQLSAGLYGHIPLNLRPLYEKRQLRALRNTIFLFPNIALGTYYSIKQASLAGKYKDVSEVIVEAYNVKMEQEKAAAEAKKEASKAVAAK